MNSNSSGGNPVRRPKFWRWLLVGAGVCLAPLVILAGVAVSYLTLDRDAAVLRRQMMTATHSGWRTKIQISLGHSTIEAVHFGLGFVQNKDITEARHALAAIRRASVGVYERSVAQSTRSAAVLFENADREMRQRGWSRLVGAVDSDDTVLIYVPQKMNTDERVDVCLAVISGNNLVVASARLDAVSLTELVNRYARDDMKRKLRLAGYSFRS